MIDLSIIEPYIIELEDYSLAEPISSINKNGFEYWIDKQIHNWCNCTICNNGFRLNQTNDKRYNHEITVAVKMIENYGGENKDYYYEELIKQHNANIEFESINGLQYNPYATKKESKKSTTSNKRNKQTSLDLDNKPKKETAAEKKLKAHAAKISSFKITLKPINNGNNSL